MNASYFEFCPRLMKMVESRTAINSDGEVVPISGASTPNNLRIIRELLKEYKPRRTMEIGLAYGASALAILSTMRELHGSDFSHVAIDPFQTSVWKGGGVQVVKEEGFEPNFRHIEALSALVLPRLVEEEASYEFIYVDGSHLFENAFVDFYYSTMLLEQGGLVLFDDCHNPHVRKVIRFIRTNYAPILTEVSLTACEDPQKSLRRRIGNAIGVRQAVAFTKRANPPRKWNEKFTPF